MFNLAGDLCVVMFCLSFDKVSYYLFKNGLANSKPINTPIMITVTCTVMVRVVRCETLYSVLMRNSEHCVIISHSQPISSVSLPHWQNYCILAPIDGASYWYCTRGWWCPSSKTLWPFANSHTQTNYCVTQMALGLYAHYNYTSACV